MTAIQYGFTSVMMDGSLEADGKTPASYDYNVQITSDVTQMAHHGGVSVEGELGVLGSLETGMGDKEDGHGAEGKLSEDQLLTDPEEAVDFVRATQVDALAIAMGTSHGAYKFSRQPDGDILAMHVIEDIHRRLPETHLVMHGSSSVPQELQDIFNEFGGDMPQTYGVPISEIERGIKHGVRKVNIDTDCRLAMAGMIRKVAQQNPSEFDLRKFMKPAAGQWDPYAVTGLNGLALLAMRRKSNLWHWPIWPPDMLQAAWLLKSHRKALLRGALSATAQTITHLARPGNPDRLSPPTSALDHL